MDLPNLRRTAEACGPARAVLVVSGTVPLLSKQLNVETDVFLTALTASSPNTDSTVILLLLRALRNLCVGAPQAQEGLRENGALTTLARLLEQLTANTEWSLVCSERGSLLVTVLQLFGNSCVENAQNCRVVWRALSKQTHYFHHHSQAAQGYVQCQLFYRRCCVVGCENIVVVSLFNTSFHTRF